MVRSAIIGPDAIIAPHGQVLSCHHLTDQCQIYIQTTGHPECKALQTKALTFTPTTRLTRHWRAPRLRASSTRLTWTTAAEIPRTKEWTLHRSGHPPKDLTIRVMLPDAGRSARHNRQTSAAPHTHGAEGEKVRCRSSRPDPHKVSSSEWRPDTLTGPFPVSRHRLRSSPHHPAHRPDSPAHRPNSIRAK
jgi:hypothetical protein